MPKREAEQDNRNFPDHLSTCPRCGDTWPHGYAYCLSCEYTDAGNHRRRTRLLPLDGDRPNGLRSATLQTTGERGA